MPKRETTRHRRLHLSLAGAAIGFALLAHQAGAQTAGNERRDDVNHAGPQSRSAIIQRLHLNDPALHISSAQWVEIDKAIRAYQMEQEISARNPLKAATSEYSPAAQRRLAREKLSSNINQFLNAEQQGILDSRLSRQRQLMERGSSKPRPSAIDSR